MNEQISRLLKEITRLEDELHDALQARQVEIRYRIEGARVRFERAVLKEHQQVKIGLLKWFRDSTLRNTAVTRAFWSLARQRITSSTWNACAPRWLRRKADRRPQSGSRLPAAARNSRSC